MEKYKEKAPISRGKDIGILRNTVRQYGEERTADLLRKFFENQDPWIEKSGRALGVFQVVLGRLLTQKPTASAVNDAWKGRPGGEVQL